MLFIDDEQARRNQIIWHKCKWIIFLSSDRNELLKVEPVSNSDWLKSFRLFLGLSAGENSNKTQLTSSAFSAPLLFAFSLLLTFFTLFSEAFCLPYLRCSALDICPFTWAFSCPLLRSSRCFHAHFFFMSFLVFLRFSDSRAPITTSLLILPIFTEIRLPQTN